MNVDYFLERKFGKVKQNNQKMLSIDISMGHWTIIPNSAPPYQTYSYMR